LEKPLDKLEPTTSDPKSDGLEEVDLLNKPLVVSHPNKEVEQLKMSQVS